MSISCELPVDLKNRLRPLRAVVLYVSNEETQNC